MYLAVDVGASKTLFAVFTAKGEISYKEKIKTEWDYKNFLKNLASTLENLVYQDLKIGCIALPGWLDLKKGIGIGFGRLPWHNVPIRQDLAQHLPKLKFLMHNDAKLAGLSEAKLADKKYHKILYLTLSTGIGGGVIVEGKIDPDFEMLEPGQMMLEHEGQTKKWEDFASGKALYKKYGQLAKDIEDKKIWHEYSQAVVIGLEALLPIIQPDLIIFGGGVGGHLEKYKHYLADELSRLKNPLVPIPPMIKAKRPEEAVIYGCYEYIKSNPEVRL